jgi:hypothetical protein
MAEREVNVRQALKDILGGMDDRSLMEKYRLTPKGLRHLYEELVDAGLLMRADKKYVMPPRKRIITGQIVNDIRSGMTDSQLMDRYRLSHVELQITCKLLVERKFITQEEIDNRAPIADDRTTPFTPRKAPRHRSPISVTAIGEEDPEKEGLVLDISEKGVGVIGVKATVGEMQTLTILGDEFGEVAPFQFDAVCRWAKRESSGELIAGFEIISISDESLDELRNWIRVCTIGFEESTD